MGLPIVLGSESMKVEFIKILVYGQGGVGKTSLAFTSKTPILIDFDQGSHRSAFRRDVININKWEQITRNEKEFYETLNGYDTIVLDTAESMIELWSVYIKKKQPKLVYDKWAFYAELKRWFSELLTRLMEYGKDIIILAHDAEEDIGTAKRKTPRITGASREKVKQLCDYVGYIYMNDRDKRELDFNPSHAFWGKNSTQMGALELPSFHDEPNYFEGVIEEMKRSLGSISASHHETLETIETAILKLSKLTTADELNAMIKDMGSVTSGKQSIWSKMQAKGKELGLTFSKTTKSFVKEKF